MSTTRIQLTDVEVEARFRRQVLGLPEPAFGPCPTAPAPSPLAVFTPEPSARLIEPTPTTRRSATPRHRPPTQARRTSGEPQWRSLLIVVAIGLVGMFLVAGVANLFAGNLPVMATPTNSATPGHSVPVHPDARLSLPDNSSVGPTPPVVIPPQAGTRVTPSRVALPTIVPGHGLVIQQPVTLSGAGVATTAKPITGDLSAPAPIGGNLPGPNPSANPNPAPAPGPTSAPAGDPAPPAIPTGPAMPPPVTHNPAPVGAVPAPPVTAPPAPSQPTPPVVQQPPPSSDQGGIGDPLTTLSDHGHTGPGPTTGTPNVNDSGVSVPPTVVTDGT